MVGNRFFENRPGFWCSPFPELYFVFSRMADDGRHVCTWCLTHRWPHRETSGGTWPMLGPHILSPGVFRAVTKRVILIGAYLLELECYKLKSGGHTPLSWVWGIRESGAWDIEGWSRCPGKPLPNPVWPEADTGRELQIPGGSAVIHFHVRLRYIHSY